MATMMAVVSTVTFEFFRNPLGGGGSFSTQAYAQSAAISF